MNTTPTNRNRKQEHVEVATQRNVTFRNRTPGFERIELDYCAMPELDVASLSTATTLFRCPLSLPLYVSGMTGGYDDAERINAMLAEVCQETGIGMGLGSMRAAIVDSTLARTFASVAASQPPLLIGNIGAVQIAEWNSSGVLADMLRRLRDVVAFDVLAIHLNPLQELLQPEGEARFVGVHQAIAEVVSALDIPVVVKEVGAGISGRVAERLVQAGVAGIDVAGAGGTSWAGVEILRRSDAERVDHLWDVGIPTAQCLQECHPVCLTANVQLLASGGITSGTDVAKSLALGAHACGIARPMLQAVLSGGVAEGVNLIRLWELHLRQWMFLTGSASVEALRSAPYTVITP